MRAFITFLFISLSLFFINCGYSFKDEGIYASIDTSKGKMIFKLDYNRAPVTVANFIGLAEGTKEYTDIKTGQKTKRPFYDELIFHRIVKGFVVQGGCPLGDGRGGPGYAFIDEFNPELRHSSDGILSMANSGPNTNGSQFFITLRATPQLDDKHSVFGEIVYGREVLSEIGKVQTDFSDRPVENIVIKAIRIKRVGDNAAAFDADRAFASSEETFKKMDEEKEKEIIAFLKKKGISENNLVKTPSGLRYYVKRQGHGKKPAKGSMITVHYTGYLPDGTKFDSTADRKVPFETEIGVGRVIPGWDEAFLSMSTGEKRMLVIPYNLAYGESGRPPVIPPRSPLIFDVELLIIRNK